jgi:hypothetical protein
MAHACGAPHQTQTCCAFSLGSPHSRRIRAAFARMTEGMEASDENSSVSHENSSLSQSELVSEQQKLVALAECGGPHARTRCVPSRLGPRIREDDGRRWDGALQNHVTLPPYCPTVRRPYRPTAAAGDTFGYSIPNCSR